MPQERSGSAAVSLTRVRKGWPLRRPSRRGPRAARGPRLEVLRDVDLTVERAGIAVLVGQNGSGKTTLLKIVAGLAQPDRGTVALFGETGAAAVAALQRRRVAYSSGERGFYFRLSARENLRLYATLDGLSGRARERALEGAIEATDLDDVIDRRFADLSSGLRQRVAIARALLGDADLLLLDEPTRTLDPLHAASIRSFVRDVLVRERGKTVIIATNSLEEAVYFGENVYVVRDAAVTPLASDDAGAPLTPDELLRAGFLDA